ncbi:hypothetical protein AYL99_08131 [Fonsecaea erecta]|uniref:Zn(2)-C6 fungal-type domain-containing protein n=1 Tax=Fonsecaea erecta TaxID=1367422 RepID=A0A178ZE00_9EURO|nr:hypothetical protein AYL99_08131 [Fonsecaea erecta]OAP57393.1 hypothetical protein AYL99_08131 [Fonsecaea erecta]
MNPQSPSNASPPQTITNAGHIITSDTRHKPTPRTRSSLACHNCRLRKIKCDVESRPSGSSCTACAQSKSQCKVNIFSDRRKHGSRQHIATLHHRIAELEALVRRNGPPSSSSSHPGGSLSHLPPRNGPALVAESLSASLNHTIPPMDRSIMTSHQDKDLDRALQNRQDYLRADTVQLDTVCGDELPVMRDFAIESPRAPTSVAGSVVPNSFAQDTTGGVSEMAAIAGHDQHQQTYQSGPSRGKEAYFGPACPLHVSSPSDIRGQDESRPIPRVHVDMDSVRLKSVLIDGYCRFQKCTVDLVHRESFLSHRKDGVRSQYYSRFYENSALACSARLSTSAAVRALSSAYAQRAKADLVTELQDPNLATVHGLLLLSDYEMSEGHDRVGWIYCGIACRILVDLGLHKEPIDTTRDADLDPNHAHICASATAGCLVYETLWCFYLGRQSTLSVSGRPLLALSAASASENVTLRPWLDLCVFLAEITALINDQTSIDNKTIDRLSELEQGLRRWHKNLPASIALDTKNISALDSAAYGLHMQYLRVQILLHSLPSVVSRKRKHGDNCFASPYPVLRGWSPEASQEVLHHNAITIIQLAVTYRETFGLETTPSIVLDNLFVAATALIAYLRKMQQQQQYIDETDAHWLTLADEMLEALHIHFHITARMRRTLACLVEDHPRISHLFSTPRRSSAADAYVVDDAKDPDQGAWGSYEAVMNDFIFDPDLLNMNEFTDIGGDFASS